MAAYTQNYNLKKPASTDNYNVDDFNNNADLIDAELKKLHGTISAVTMRASGWSNGQYSFESTYPASRYDIEIALASTASQTQIDAFNSAGILSNATSNIVVASGIVPSVDIPIVFKAVEK